MAINTRFVRGLCLEVHDLTISMLIADLDFARLVFQCGMVRKEVLRERLAETDLDDQVRELVSARIEACRG